MNPQSQEPYLNLVQKLLNCSSGQESEILAANQDLVDAGFLQTLEVQGEMFLQQGNRDRANRLRGLTIQIGENLNLATKLDLQSLSQKEIQKYFQFLMKVLDATRDSSGDPQTVYPLLAANTNKLNDIFVKLFHRWTLEIIAQAKLETVETITEIISDFSNLICQFPSGNIGRNVEIGIIGHQIILTIVNRTNSPQNWARTQNNLSGAYVSRIRGDRTENLEKAIAASHAAQEVFTSTAFPQQWAETQISLSNAYSSRIRGDRAENLEKAILACNAALEVFTTATLPQLWAMVKTNLGLAYIDRIIGDKAENLEQAIIAVSATLQVFTRSAFPQQWARTHSSLGIAYRVRIIGDRAENLEKAITACNAALEVFTTATLPQLWASAQINLGVAYRERIKGDKAENLEKAIAAYQQSLVVYTHDAFPELWARAQNNLGNAYKDRIRGDKAENLEKAIAAYQQSLVIYTHDAFPEQWARMQHNLGIAYRERTRGNKAENLGKAIAALQQALIIRTRDTLSAHYVESLFNLGIAYKQANYFREAYDSFKPAIETAESLRNEIISGEESRRKQAEESHKLYCSMIEVCLKLDKIPEAVEYVERSKTRNLVEQILERDSKTIFPSEVVTQLEKYRDEIATDQYQIQNGKAENPKVLSQHLQQLRQQRNEFQNRYLPVGYGFKFDLFQATLDQRVTIIEWYILDNNRILAFIFTQKGEASVWQSRPEDREAWENCGIQYLQSYYDKKEQWLSQLGENLKELASILHIDEILDKIPNCCDELILIPHRVLHLYPLHALPVNQYTENSSCLLDLFPRGVSYAPSCQLLQQLQKRERPDFQSLFAIQNPTEDLNYTDLEVQVIQSHFNTSNILKKTAATLTAINNSDLTTCHCAHFSCHGYFDLTNPAKSALILANAPIAYTPTEPDSERYLNVRLGETHDLEKCLTLDKIFSLKLNKCRLVTLSACETGLIDFNNTSDEYIGLPSGFLLSGSKAIVSSLWTVSDLSTAFLMIKFYEDLQTINSVSLALNQAQQWLRNLTTEEFTALLIKYESQIEEVFTQLPEENRPLARAILRRTCKRKPHPFAAPFYWAGFIATGN